MRRQRGKDGVSSATLAGSALCWHFANLGVGGAMGCCGEVIHQRTDGDQEAQRVISAG